MSRVVDPLIRDCFAASLLAMTGFVGPLRLPDSRTSCSDTNRWYRASLKFGQNGVGGFGPDEGFGVGVVLRRISTNGSLHISDRADEAAADALSRHLGEEVLHCVEPGRRGRGEVKGPARCRSAEASTVRARSTCLRRRLLSATIAANCCAPRHSTLRILAVPYPRPPKSQPHYRIGQ